LAIVHRSRRTTYVGLLAAIAAILATVALVGVAPASPASAAPDPQAQIDKLWAQLEPLIEQYNGVHTKLLADQAKQAVLQKQLDPLLTQVNLATSRVGAIAAGLYMQGPLAGVNAMLGGGGPATLADRLGSLDAIASTQQATIADVADLVKNYQDQKKPLDDLIAREKAIDADLAAKKAQIQGQVAALQKLISNSAVNIAVLKPTNCPVVAGSGGGQTAAVFACSQIGKPYRWGEDGPTGYDCSGLTKASWAKAGVSLDHYTYDQWTHTKHVSTPAVGDLVFYFSDVHHVAIYVGGGWVVHAPHPGDHVRMAKMTSIATVKGYAHPGG
jgi:cell wall-associated NlpC family hydrolase